MDSGSRGLAPDGSTKEVRNGEIHVHLNHGDKPKDHPDIGPLYMYNALTSNGIEKLYPCILPGHLDNDGAPFIESPSCANVDSNVGMEPNKRALTDGKTLSLCIKVDNCLSHGDHGVTL